MAYKKATFKHFLLQFGKCKSKVFLLLSQLLVIFKYTIYHIVLRVLCLNYQFHHPINYLENYASERKIITLTKWFTTVK